MSKGSVRPSRREPKARAGTASCCLWLCLSDCAGASRGRVHCGGGGLPGGSRVEVFFTTFFQSSAYLLSALFANYTTHDETKSRLLVCLLACHFFEKQEMGAWCSPLLLIHLTSRTPTHKRQASTRPCVRLILSSGCKSRSSPTTQALSRMLMHKVPLPTVSGIAHCRRHTKKAGRLVVVEAQSCGVRVCAASSRARGESFRGGCRNRNGKQQMNSCSHSKPYATHHLIIHTNRDRHKDNPIYHF